MVFACSGAPRGSIRAPKSCHKEAPAATTIADQKRGSKSVPRRLENGSQNGVKSFDNSAKGVLEAAMVSVEASGRLRRASLYLYKCGLRPGRLSVTCAPAMAGPAPLFGHPKLVLYSGTLRLPGGSRPDSQNGAGSVPGASQERNGRHRVDHGICMLWSTSAGWIWAQIGSRRAVEVTLV